jgi:hypothetical protein
MFRQPLRNAKERLRLFLSERGRRARVLRDSLRRQPDRIDPSSRFVSGFCYGYGKREARGLELLKEWLSPEQFAQYDAKSYFEVTGCHSGKRYRISHGTSMNIHELDGAGCPCVGWCIAPKGYLVAGDVMLAQKIALETDERGAERREQVFCANRPTKCIPPPQAALFGDRFAKKHVALRLALRSVDAGRSSGRG